MPRQTIIFAPLIHDAAYLYEVLRRIGNFQISNEKYGDYAGLCKFNLALVAKKRYFM